MQNKPDKRDKPFAGYFNKNNKKKATSQLDDFEKMKKLGRGSYGEVWQVMRK